MKKRKQKVTYDIIPVDVWAEVFQFLNINFIIEIRRTCKTFFHAFSHPVSLKNFSTSRNLTSFIFLFSNFLHFKTNNILTLELDLLPFLWILKIAKSRFIGLRHLSVFTDKKNYFLEDLKSCRNIQLRKTFPNLQKLNLPPSKELTRLLLSQNERNDIFLPLSSPRFADNHLIFHPSSYLELISYKGLVTIEILKNLNENLEELCVTFVLKNEQNNFDINQFRRFKILKVFDFLYLGRYNKVFSCLSNTIEELSVMNYFKEINSNFKKLKKLILRKKLDGINGSSVLRFDHECLEDLEIDVTFERIEEDAKKVGCVIKSKIKNLTLRGFERNYFTNLGWDKVDFTFVLENPSCLESIICDKDGIFCIENDLKVSEFSNIKRMELYCGKGAFSTFKVSGSFSHDIVESIKIKHFTVLSPKSEFSFFCSNLKEFEINDCVGVFNLHCKQMVKFSCNVYRGSFSYEDYLRAYKETLENKMGIYFNAPELKELCYVDGHHEFIDEIRFSNFYDSKLKVIRKVNIEVLKHFPSYALENVKFISIVLHDNYYVSLERYVNCDDFFTIISQCKNLETLEIRDGLFKTLSKQKKKKMKTKISDLNSSNSKLKTFKLFFQKDVIVKSSFNYALMSSAFSQLETLILNPLFGFGLSDLKVWMKKDRLKHLKTIDIIISKAIVRKLNATVLYGLVLKFTKQVVNFSMKYEGEKKKADVIYEIDLSKRKQLVSFCIDDEIKFIGNSENLEYLSLSCNFFKVNILKNFKKLKVLEIRKCREFNIMDEKFISSIVSVIDIQFLSFRSYKETSGFSSIKYKSQYEFFKEREKWDKFEMEKFIYLQKKFEKDTCLIFSK